MDKLPAFQIFLPLDNSKKLPSISFELSNLEYGCIGLVTVQWSYLEHALMLVQKNICKSIDETFSEKAESLSFKNRLNSFHDCLSKHADRIDGVEAFISIHGKIAKLQHERHKIIHGIWDYDPKNPFFLNLFNTRKNVDFQGIQNLDSIYEFSREIGEVNYFLTYVKIGDECLGDLPQTGVVKKNGQAVGHMHRSFMMSEEERERLFPEFFSNTDVKSKI